MKTLEIEYNPHKKETRVLIDGIDVCNSYSYDRLRDFIEEGTSLQTWIEPIEDLGWEGIVNEVSSPDVNDEVKVVFSGRKTDFTDLKKSIENQNSKRPERTRVSYIFEHISLFDDDVLDKNIESVLAELETGRFKELVEKCPAESSLKENYQKINSKLELVKDNELPIAVAGACGSGKSMLLNVLIRHNILPTSGDSCISKKCKIRHDESLGKKVALTCYDSRGNVIETKVYKNDIDCAAVLLDIFATKSKKRQGKGEKIAEVEICANLSHLYPEGINKKKFTIVLLDTPGMNGNHMADTSSDIVMDIISDANKPMIILCADANDYENESISKLMQKIAGETENEDGELNDRFLFLLNKSDALEYKKDESAEDVKTAFAKYLKESAVFCFDDDIERYEKILNFVPRIFMTSACVASSIQQRTYEFTDEQKIGDPVKKEFFKCYESFKDKIGDYRKCKEYSLIEYCDVPNYRKEELQKEFKAALENGEELRAVELQTGLACVEIAIKDYIEKHAYPIKVRGLLNTFKDIARDLDEFDDSLLAELDKLNAAYQEKLRNLDDTDNGPKGAEKNIEKLLVLKDDTQKYLDELSKTCATDEVAFEEDLSTFRKTVFENDAVKILIANKKVNTGQKTRKEVLTEIHDKMPYIELCFICAEDLHKVMTKHYNLMESTESLKYELAIKGLSAFGIQKVPVRKPGERKGIFRVMDGHKIVVPQQNFDVTKAEKLLRQGIVNRSTKRVKKEKGLLDILTDVIICTETRRNIMTPFPDKVLKDEYVDVPVDGYYTTVEFRKYLELTVNDMLGEVKEAFEKYKGLLKSYEETMHEYLAIIDKKIKHCQGEIKLRKEIETVIFNDAQAYYTKIQSIEATHVWVVEFKRKICQI